MKKLILIGLFMLGTVGAAQATTLTINEVADYGTAGDYFVRGNLVPAGTGRVFEILKFTTSKTKEGGVWYDLDSAYDGSEKAEPIPYAADKAGDQSIAGIWGALKDGGIESTYKFIFALDVNEPVNEGNGGRMDILFLDVYLNGTTYSLNGDQIEAWGVSQKGSGVGDLIFEVDLGYDFMTAYDATWTDPSLFKIEARHLESNNDDTYFVSPTYYGTPVNSVPEPATMALFGLGLGGLGLLRRKYQI